MWLHPSAFSIRALHVGQNLTSLPLAQSSYCLSMTLLHDEKNHPWYALPHLKQISCSHSQTIFLALSFSARAYLSQPGRGHHLTRGSESTIFILLNWRYLMKSASLSGSPARTLFTSLSSNVLLHSGKKHFMRRTFESDISTRSCSRVQSRQKRWVQSPPRPAKNWSSLLSSKHIWQAS